VRKFRAAVYLLTCALLALGCSVAGSERHAPSGHLTEVTVSVSGWNDARVSVVLIDGSGKRTGWQLGGTLREIAGCSHGFGTDVGIPDETVPDDSAAVQELSVTGAPMDTSRKGRAAAPMYHYFSIFNDAVTKVGLIDQGGCELLMDPLVAGRVDLAITGLLGGHGMCQDTTTVWVTPGIPVRRWLSWRASSGECTVGISAMPARKQAKPSQR
jgi:hypothetical protein